MPPHAARPAVEGDHDVAFDQSQLHVEGGVGRHRDFVVCVQPHPCHQGPSKLATARAAGANPVCGSGAP
eukprot:9538464-Lingulodinium_polyedra.AAC.1